MSPFPRSMILTPVSRWPTRLPEETVRMVLERPLPVRRRPVEGAAGAVRQPRASVVILTFNGLVYTMLCLKSLLVNTDYPDFEVIVVDNGSTDGTREYLERVARRHSRLRLVFNDANVGFAAGTNRGLAAATGDVMVPLNNDTVVPRGWLTSLVAHLADPAIGLVGPVTNRAGNEAQIEAPYRVYGDFARFAEVQAERHRGRLSDIPMLTMFCTAMRREVYERIGPLDERFEVGLFEDDDYAMRVRLEGYRVVCAEDVFVHHFGQGSMGELGPSGDYGRLYHANRARWEAKWSTAWESHRRRPDQQYQELVAMVREVVRSVVPADASVVVISKGDEDLLMLDGRRASHFPQDESGGYAGFHPADSAAAIAHLEDLRAQGAEFLVIPSSSFWWLDHYGEFRHHVTSRYVTVRPPEGSCAIFSLRECSNGV